MIIILLAFLSILVFYPNLQDSFSLAKLAYLSVLSVFALFSLWRLFFADDLRVPLSAVFLSYGAILLLSTWPHVTHESLTQLSLDFIGLLIFLYVVNRVKSKSIQTCVMGYVLMVFCMLLFSVFTSYWPEFNVTGRSAAQATMGNIKYPALLVFTALPSALYLAGNLKAQWQKILLINVAAMFTLCIVMNDSQMALYGPLILVAAMIVLLVISSKNQLIPLVLKAAIAGFFLAIMLAITVGLYYVLPVSHKQRLSIGINNRIAIWQVAQPLLNNPLGIGRGNFQLRYPKQGLERLTTHAHNDYLELLIEIGPLGLILFSAFSGYIFFLPSSLIGNYLKASAMATLVSALFWFPLSIAPMAVSYWVFLGLIYVDSKANG